MKWWQTAVFYQVYPRSFADGNGDGIGDFPGMIARLDYLQELGIDAIWLSPHYPSPLHDCGYDIADYTAVAPEYGSLEDFRRFLDGCHRRGIRLILDLVLNHTSDEHPWFIESRLSRDNSRRDWYIWRDGKDGGPPNNWRSFFGGPAWEYDPQAEQYYYHFFFKQQPDLNWRNPEVKQAMFDAARFWLDLGVDGFRLDAIGTLYEQPDLRDHQASLTQDELYRLARLSKNTDEQMRRNVEFRKMYQHQVNLPGVHTLMRELRALVDEYDDRVLVGETDDISYYGDGSNELHLVFNFPLMRTERITPAWVRANQKKRLSSLPPAAWPCNTLGNHDSPRVLSRFGDGSNNEDIARISLALMLTLRGTPFLYNGEEIGMSDYPIQDLEKFRDRWGVWVYQLERDVLGASHPEALAYAARFCRDKCRTPVQWRNAANAGFSPAGVETWLPVNPDYAAGINVEDQERDPHSMLNFYRRLLAMRKRTPALIGGSYIPLDPESQDYFAFLRHSPEYGQTCLVALNMSSKDLTLHFGRLDRLVEGLRDSLAHLIFSNRTRQAQVEGESEHPNSLRLAPYEIYLGELVKSG